MKNTNDDNAIILNSALKHGVSVIDMKKVIIESYVIARLREEPAKLLYLGFDSKGRALEVITDTGIDGQVYIIHADKITKRHEKLLKEVL